MPKIRRARGTRGAAAIEFALILPVLILLLFGIIEFARGYNVKTQVTHAAREAARALAIDSGDPATVAANAAPALNSSELSVTASADPCVDGTDATVSVSYPFDPIIPLFEVGTLTLESTGVMRCGG